MGRLVVIVIVVVLLVWLLRRAIAGPRRDGAPPDAGDGPSAAPQGDLVNCAHCGVNLPKSEAYAASGVLPSAGGRYYCSEEHWRRGPPEG